MCDYSLEHYQSRPARIGETYETTRFTSGSIGFIEPGVATVAVCMACDTKLALSRIPAHLQSRLAVSETATATFTRLDSGLYRDGVRFDSGASVSLQELGIGVRAQIVDTLVAPLPGHEAPSKAEVHA